MEKFKSFLYFISICLVVLFLVLFFKNNDKLRRIYGMIFAAVPTRNSRDVDSGVFHLTGTPGQGGPGVSRTTDGRELCYEPGQKVRFSQLKKVGKIGIINHRPGDPPWETTKKTIVSARAFTADCVELASLWGIELFVRVEIINPP